MKPQEVIHRSVTFALAAAALAALWACSESASAQQVDGARAPWSSQGEQVGVSLPLIRQKQKSNPAKRSETRERKTNEEIEMSATETLTQDSKSSSKQAELKLPEAKVELPSLPYDKAQLAGIGKLDAMIVDAARLAASVERVSGQFEKLKRASQTSLNGTAADQVKALLVIIDAFEDFAAQGKGLAKLARKAFMAKFASDDEFSSKYRETYSKAENELDDVIADHKTRRSVVSVMMSSYRNTPRTQLGYLESMLDDATKLREQAIDQVIRSAETGMMVADYKKGRALIDLLQSTRNKLTLIGKLAPESAKIAAILAKVAEKEASRQKEVQEARAAYRFPARYAASNAPENSAELEAAMRADLEKAGYRVKAIVVADHWVPVHSPLGIHLYNQIDFHVAVRSQIPEEAESGVLDVLYVTGKTGTSKPELPFVRRSSGTVAQMLESNLEG